MDGLAWHGSIVKRVVPVTPTSYSKEFVMVASTSKSPDTEINTDAPLTERSVAAAHEAIDNLSARMARTEKSLRRSEEHTSELQSRGQLVCRLLLEKKKKHE